MTTEVARILSSLDCLLADLPPDIRDAIEQHVGIVVHAAEAKAQLADLLTHIADGRAAVIAATEREIKAQDRELAHMRRGVDAQRQIISSLRRTAALRQWVINSQEELIRELTNRVEDERHRLYRTACEGKEN